MSKKSLLSYLLIAAFGLTLLGCGGDYRREAVGGFGDVVVLMDSSRWDDSETAQAIRETFGQLITTLPRAESLYDLQFRDIRTNAQLDDIRIHKNIIIAAPIDDSSNVAGFVRAILADEVEERVRSGASFAFPFEDQWRRNQWTLVLTSTSDSLLAREIRTSSETLTDNLTDKELRRWNEEIYERGEKTDIEDSLMTNHGWMVRVQHDWFKNIDTTYTRDGATQHIVTMRRVLPENDRWFWAWWKDGVEPSMADSIDQEWINARRDSLMKEWVRGTRPDSYITTEYRHDVFTESLQLNGDRAWETAGVWRMTGDAMGGPFRTMTVYDDETRRLFILEFGQFAPKYDKRQYVRQFRAMLRTFRTDSTWNAETPMAAN